MHHQTILERAASWIGDLLSKITFGIGGGPGFLGNLVALGIVAGLVVLAVAIVRALLRYRRPPKPEPENDLTIDTEAGRAASDWRGEAERFEAAGQWREAMRARYRELVRSLIEDGLLDDVPGRTTGEYRAAFERASPATGAAASFAELTDLFEAVWYGGVATGEDDNRRFRQLARAAREREAVGV